MELDSEQLVFNTPHPATFYPMEVYNQNFSDEQYFDNYTQNDQLTIITLQQEIARLKKQVNDLQYSNDDLKQRLSICEAKFHESHISQKLINAFGVNVQNSSKAIQRENEALWIKNYSLQAQINSLMGYSSSSDEIEESDCSDEELEDTTEENNNNSDDNNNNRSLLTEECFEPGALDW